ncbi:MAG: glycosyltransferase family 4 protein [Nitrospina sp.]|jgi:glycosyltransferase involved in cell wall biosynthesis|nr:glycosyltransferase family 4 protein [Nitrospina sp.]
MDKPQKKLTILSLQYHCYPDEIGGAWGLTYQINKRLVERGHKVYQITCKSSETQKSQEVIDGIQYHRISYTASKSIISIWNAIRKQLRIILRAEPIHLIHIHNPLIGFIALLQPNLWKVPKVYHFHSSWFDEERINAVGTGGVPLGLKLRLEMIRGMEWACYKFSRVILILSEYSKERFKEYYSLSKPKLVKIPGGVDLKEFHPITSEENRGDIFERLNLGEIIPLILTVRRLEERMGLENLVLAAEILVKKNPGRKFKLVIVGKGSLRERLENLIEKKNLSDTVQLSGLVPRETLPLYFRAADLFVLPTTAIEGFGLVTAEAFASGLPVMGTPVGATKELLALVDHDLIFEGSTPESLAKGIEKFLTNPDYYSQLRLKCRETAERNYSWERVTDQTENVFKEIVFDNNA